MLVYRLVCQPVTLESWVRFPDVALSTAQTRAESFLQKFALPQSHIQHCGNNKAKRWGWVFLERTHSQWNPVYKAFYRTYRCGNETIRR